GMVGGARDVAMLAKVAAGDGGDAGNAARASLAQLRGDDVNRTLVSAIRGGDAKTKVVLINALAARTATECAPAVANCANDPDASVSKAAIEAMGALGNEKQIPALIAMLKAGKDAGSIDKALTAICSRAKEKAAAGVIAGIRGATADAQVVLYNALGRCGGQKALDAVLAGTKGSDAKAADGAIRVLCNWPDKAAIDPLLAIAGGTENQTHQVLAVRGVVRLARLRETPGDVRWRSLNQAMKLAKKTSEKKQVLGALSDVPTVEALRLVAMYVDDKALAEEAGAAAVRIADKVSNKDKDLTRKTMLTVMENVKSKRTKGDARKVLNKVGPKP
ncbi:MAG: HEAT repeat domain-containing protein, partial [Phycisphaerae bacterium]